MRPGDVFPASRPSHRFAERTAVDWTRSRLELERVLNRYGAQDVAIFQTSASASVRFALDRYLVELFLPLPDRFSEEFIRTPGDRLRQLSAQERAYEQAVRRQWRALVLVTKGKLEAVACGISSLETEFGQGFLSKGDPVNEFDRRARSRVRALARRASRTVPVGIGAGLLVPISGFVALALPVSAAERLATPFWGEQPEIFVGDDAELAASGAGGRLAPVGFERSDGSSVEVTLRYPAGRIVRVAWGDAEKALGVAGKGGGLPSGGSASAPLPGAVDGGSDGVERVFAAGPGHGETAGASETSPAAGAPVPPVSDRSTPSAAADNRREAEQERKSEPAPKAQETVPQNRVDDDAAARERAAKERAAQEREDAAKAEAAKAEARERAAKEANDRAHELEKADQERRKELEKVEKARQKELEEAAKREQAAKEDREKADREAREAEKEASEARRKAEKDAREAARDAAKADRKGRDG